MFLLIILQILQAGACNVSSSCVLQSKYNLIHALKLTYTQQTIAHQLFCSSRLPYHLPLILSLLLRISLL